MKFKEYKQLDGSMKTQISEVGPIIRRFDKTPYPIAETDVVCPHFMLCAWANGCMYNCGWCYLKGTFRFYGQKENGRVPIILKDRARIAEDITKFLKADLPPEVINTGELSDSLLDEKESDAFSTWIMSFFKGSQHKVLFLTKSANISNFLKNSWQDNAILSWSINADKVARTWEHYAPEVKERLTAAANAYNKGYEVRLRIDPMVAINGWQTQYADLVDVIAAKLRPSRITLGCLRGLTTTIIHAKDKTWVEYLTEKSSWGKKPSFESRLMMYEYVMRALWRTGLRNYAICKDTLAMWRRLGLSMKTIKCNCTW